MPVPRPPGAPGPAPRPRLIHPICQHRSRSRRHQSTKEFASGSPSDRRKGEALGLCQPGALRMAQTEVRLMEVAATAQPPVCNLDYGKFKYEKKSASTCETDRHQVKESVRRHGKTSTVQV